MSTIKCTGIIAPINKFSNNITCDQNGDYNIIPITLAQQIEKQTDVPIFIAHKDQYKIGCVDRFFITQANVLTQEQCVLCAEFTLDDPNFIQALKEVTSFKYIQWMDVNVFSPDEFISSHSTMSDEIYMITADIALMQKFAGLSIGHNGKSHLADEVSICMAGKRPLTVITSAKFCKADNTEEDHIEPEKVKSYKEIFTIYSFSIRNSANKVEKDLQLLNLPQTCLSYDLNNMLHVDGHNAEEKNEVGSDQTKKLLESLLNQIHKTTGVKKTKDMKTRKRKRCTPHYEEEYVSEDSSSDDDASRDKRSRTKGNNKRPYCNYAHNGWNTINGQAFPTPYYPTIPQSCWWPGNSKHTPSPFMLPQQPQFILPYHQHQQQQQQQQQATPNTINMVPPATFPNQTQYLLPNTFIPPVDSGQIKNTLQEQMKQDIDQSGQIQNTSQQDIVQDINKKLQDLSTSFRNHHVNTPELAQMIVHHLKQDNITGEIQQYKSGLHVQQETTPLLNTETFTAHSNVQKNDTYSLPHIDVNSKIDQDEQPNEVNMDQMLQDAIDNI